MDFTNRGTLGSSPVQHDPNLNRPGTTGPHKSGKKGDWSNSKFFRFTQAILAFCVVVVVVSLLVFLAISDWSNNVSENSYVQDNKLQAVFLNTGQVYFGNIKSLNTNYLVLTNIFYLQTSSSGSSSSSSSSSANQSVTLVKLGCEIHAPLDQMVINRSSVTFWENLSPSGQVSKAVATWEKENPNGQKCSDQSTAGTSGQSTPQNATNSTSTGTTTNGTSTSGSQ